MAEYLHILNWIYLLSGMFGSLSFVVELLIALLTHILIAVYTVDDCFLCSAVITDVDSWVLLIFDWKVNIL